MELYEKISEILKSKEQIELTKEDMEKYGIKENEKGTEIKPIEDYWKKVIINSGLFTITEKDEKILNYVTNVKLVKFPEKLRDFRVDFYFKPNDYFNNEIISKKYIFNNHFDLIKAESTSIDWKNPEKNKAEEKKIIKMNNRHDDSFFAFFSRLDNVEILEEEYIFFQSNFFDDSLNYYFNFIRKKQKDKTEQSNDNDLDEKENSEDDD